MFIDLGDHGSGSLLATPACSPPPPAKLFDIRPTWLRDLHHQLQVPKPCEGREEVLSANSLAPNAAKWQRGVLFCQQRAVAATTLWDNWCRWY